MMYLLNLNNALRQDLDRAEKERFQVNLINKIALTFPELVGNKIEVVFPKGVNGNDLPIEILLRIDIKGKIRSKPFSIPDTARDGVNVAFQEFRSIIDEMEQTKDLSKLLERLI